MRNFDFFEEKQWVEFANNQLQKLNEKNGKNLGGIDPNSIKKSRVSTKKTEVK